MVFSEKHGDYEKFNMRKARWTCPECRKDNLGIHTDVHSTRAWFVCHSCWFDSRTLGTFDKHKMRYNDSATQVKQVYALRNINEGLVKILNAGFGKKKEVD
jgi:transposase-like protein